MLDAIDSHLARLVINDVENAPVSYPKAIAWRQESAELAHPWWPGIVLQAEQSLAHPSRDGRIEGLEIPLGCSF
jgi:hypothetical protein